jgi:hypothetical protein
MKRFEPIVWSTLWLPHTNDLPLLEKRLAPESHDFVAVGWMQSMSLILLCYASMRACTWSAHWLLSSSKECLLGLLDAFVFDASV